jgi:hypothetical protein
MSQKNYKNISREDFMSFFRDSNKIEMLSDEDKTEIASQLLMKDRNFFVKLLNNINGGYYASINQIIEERNSLPVF